ncbi:ankyrin repeat domain-containing protein [Sphingomonas sp. GC_Shp_2]|uniref:ankyrin repeat domain-containing protein n=1 Tax=unclassified Sphingomonas TaxID=196159 RepID=UPI003211E5E9
MALPAARAPRYRTAMTDAPAPPPLPSPERLRELMFDAARMGRDDVIPALLHAGVPIEIRDGRGHTPLVLASYNGHADTTALLLDRGAAVDGDADHRGNTALMGVAFKGHLAIAALLIARGADVNRRNAAGQTALMLAGLFDRSAIIDLLLENGADAAMIDGDGNTVRSLALAQGNEALAKRFA